MPNHFQNAGSGSCSTSWTVVFAFVLALALTFTAVQPAQAQTFKVIHNFGLPGDGASPFAGITRDSSGTLYGVTFSGPPADQCFGIGCGTAFKLVSNADGTWTETILYEFMGGNDGLQPVYAVVLDSKGNVYGTTQGIDPQPGTVFELVRKSDGTYTKQTLQVFTDPMRGLQPQAVTLDSLGRVLGTTAEGGPLDLGGVFRLDRITALHWYERVLFPFDDPYGVPGKLRLDGEGNIYGTAFFGGTSGNGAVFKLSSIDGLTWNLTVLYSFTGGADGANPYAGPTFDQQGNLYGTTQRGGGSAGCGTVFELTPTSDGDWSESVLYAFQDVNDGCFPTSELALDASGNLYGTTLGGGEGGQGTVFKLSRSGTGQWVKQAIHSFAGPEGADPYNFGGVVVDSNGNVFGTAVAGGTGTQCNTPDAGCGVVWEITP